MICFTVEDDKIPFRGISIGSNENGLMVGIKGNFCHIADGFNYGRTPEFTLTSDPRQRVHIPKTGLWAVIYNAGVTNKLGIAEPLLCYPEEDDLPQAILVYWVIDQSLDGQVRIDLSDKTSYSYYETTNHSPYFEGLYTIAEGGMVTAFTNSLQIRLQNVNGLPTIRNIR